MTAREMIDAERQQTESPVCEHGWVSDTCPYCIYAVVYAAAERVIERLSAALDEQTSRANHHEERATEYQALLRECNETLKVQPDASGYKYDLCKRIRAALGEV